MRSRIQRRTGFKKHITAWMSDPVVWHRESYQRNYAASKIQGKYKGKKYVVLCSDVDEIPNRDFVTELSDAARL